MLDQRRFADAPAAGDHGQIAGRSRMIGYPGQTFKLGFAAKKIS